MKKAAKTSPLLFPWSILLHRLYGVDALGCRSVTVIR